MIKSLSLYYLLQKAYFEVQDLLAIMEPVLSHYSFLFLQSKYTWPPFKTFDDIWLVISMILYSIMSAFFTAVNHKASPSGNSTFYEKHCLFQPEVEQ